MAVRTEWRLRGALCVWGGSWCRHMCSECPVVVVSMYLHVCIGTQASCVCDVSRAPTIYVR